MPLVEHAEVQDDASEHATLASTQQQAARDQASVALDCAHTCSYNTPGQSEHGQVFTTAHYLEKPVGWDVDEDIEDVEHGERDIVLVASEFQVVDEAVDFGIADLVAVRYSSQDI